MGTGGMRTGAGRPGSKAKAEHLHRIEVGQWARRGYLRGPCTFSWVWHRDGERTGAISVYVDSPGRARLVYGITKDGETRDASQKLGIVSTACALGGQRAWFACPLCSRRAGVLYLRWARFACRHCQRVAYSSQSEDGLDRLWRKQSKIERRLDDNWQRPKGMRQHTHRRLVDQVIELETLRDAALCEFAARLGLAL